MYKLIINIAVILIENVIAEDFLNYCDADVKLSLKKSEMQVKCNSKAKEISGNNCIYTVENECFTFSNWDGHGSKFCPNDIGGLT